MGIEHVDPISNPLILGFCVDSLTPLFPLAPQPIYSSIPTNRRGELNQTDDPDEKKTGSTATSVHRE